VGGHSASAAEEEKEALKRELKMYFFISPQDRIEDIEEENTSPVTSTKKSNFGRSTSMAISKVK
jgi:hypothetical protein